MSKTRDTQTVYFTRKAESDKRWHTTKDQDECYNAPDDPKSLEKWKLKGMYKPCAICTDAESDNAHNANQAEYECERCGTQDRLGCTGVRTLHACQECNDVTSWERIEDVR